MPDEPQPQFEELARKAGSDYQRVERLLSDGANPAQIAELLQMAADNGLTWEPPRISGLNERVWPTFYKEHRQLLQNDALAKQLGVDRPALGGMNRDQVSQFLEFLRDNDLKWDPKEVPYGGDLQALEHRVKLHAEGEKQSALGYSEDYLGTSEIGSNANREANAEIRREREAEAAKAALTEDEKEKERTPTGVPPSPINNPAPQTSAEPAKPPESQKPAEPRADTQPAAETTPPQPAPAPQPAAPAPVAAPASAQPLVIGFEKGNLPPPAAAPAPGTTRTR